MTVAGRVLDPDGKPVKGAVVDLVARPRSPWVGASDEIDQHTLLGQGQSDGDGRFQLDAPRTASTRVFEVYAIAAAPGYGLGWAELNPDAEQPVGRHPAPARAGRPRPAGRRDRRAGQGRRGDCPGRRPHERQGQVRRRLRSGTSSPEGIRVWPRPVKTDDQGRIALPGIGRGAPRQPRACATSATPGRTCRSIRPSVGRQGDHPRARAGADHRGPRAGRRHRPADPECRRLGLDARDERARAGLLHRQVPRRRPGAVHHEPDRRRELHPRRLPDRRRAVPDPAGRVHVDQGGGQSNSRHQGPPRRA